MPPQLTVVVPAFNEVARLGPTLDRLCAFTRALPGGAEIIVVDDGSSDGTAEVAARSGCAEVRCLSLGRNRGKGAALRAGVIASTGEEVLLCDADLSTPIEDYDRLRPHLATAGLVLGSRGLADSRITRRQPRYRELMGRLFNLLVRTLAVRGISDTQCGFKLLRGDLARALFPDLKIDRFAYDVEMLWLARRRGAIVVEVGVTWHDSPATSVHAVRDSLRMLVDVGRIRWHHRHEPATTSSAGLAPPVRR